MNPDVLIFSHSITPRLRYVVAFLEQYFGARFGLTSDEDKYLASAAAVRINYSYHRLQKEEVFIHSHVLLTESSVRPVKVECFQQPGFSSAGDYPAFFRAEGELGFDLFAAIFYLITRYEEYLPHKKDEYGRFSHASSTAFREGFLHLPLVNLWLEDLRERLVAMGAGSLRVPARSFRFQPTYDIDMAWSFRNKGFKRNAGGLLRLLLRFRFGQLAQRIAVLRGRRPDPFDVYEWLDALHKGLDPVYFFLVAKERGRYDKNIDVDHPAFRELVHQLSDQYRCGLHPSWHSGDHPQLLAREKAVLETMTGKSVVHSRQHFIRFDLPATYQRLLQAGIEEDYSMGYGSINGFRASITTPFYWYDLKNETPTKLLFRPFCFMDANAYYEQKLTPEEAARELRSYGQQVRAVHGEMITIWHNSILGTDPAFAGWREVYGRFVQEVVGSGD